MVDDRKVASREAIAATFSSTNHVLATRRQAQALLMTLKADITLAAVRGMKLT